MQVKILKNTVANRQSVKIGDVVDLPDREAAILIAYKCAEGFKENQSTDDSPAADEIKPIIKKRGKK